MSRYIYLAFAVVIAALIFLSIDSEKQNIADWLALRNYQAPSQIAEIAREDGMTSYSKKVFYVNHPKIQAKSNFAKECPNNSEQMVVLGCYHPFDQGIYILAVNNVNLAGIEQVTAAYETLHAIYQRLSHSAVKKLNAELISFEYHGLNNVTVKQQIASFRISEPGAVLNEMTSLFGTEVANLPSSLKAFYAQYFNNRQVLLNYYNDYQQAFTSREDKINAYSAQLASLKSQISADQSELSQQAAVISQQEQTLDSELVNGENSDYNVAIAAYNQQVDSYNSLVSALKGLVGQYNQIVSERNALVFEEQQLVQALSSSPSTLSTK